MGKRGPQPKPTRLKVVRGNPGHQKLPKNEAQYENVESIEPPDFLDDHGKEMFHRKLEQLQSIEGLFQQADIETLIAYCEAWQEFRAAYDTVRKEGILAHSEKGAVYQHPAVGVKNKALERMSKYGAKFGWSPADRVGLNVGEPKKQDDFARWAKGRG